MVHFTNSLVLPHAPDVVFAFLTRPANLAALRPPELGVQLIEAPEQLSLGARLTWKARRWGISQRIVMAITALEENVSFTEEQREGPLTSWRHTRRLESLAEGTRLVDEIDFEPPTGLLGKIVTATTITKELEDSFAWRDQRLALAISAALS